MNKERMKNSFPYQSYASGLVLKQVKHNSEMAYYNW